MATLLLAGLFLPSSWHGAWFCVTVLIGLVWLRRHLDLRQARKEPVLTESDADAAPEAWPRLSVLVAAKDEEENIRRCVEGLLAQDYPDFQVIAVDDRSADRTGAILDELARGDERLTVLHVTELPEGWFGKNNAMRMGVERADGAWLCFTDADCSFDSPRLLRAAVAFALRTGADFLSVLPRLEARGFWERVVQPVAGAVMVFWFPPQKVNDPASERAYANGAFMLMDRETYGAIGGHAFARATLNEDMHFARQAKRVGRRLRVVRSANLYRVRMYSGFKQIWRGWSRIFYGCFGTFARLLASLGMLAVFSVSPYVTLLASPGAGSAWPWLAGSAGFAILAQQSVLWRFYRISGNAPGWALSYPLGAVLCLGMLLNAMTRLWGRGTTWRGTTYRGGAQVEEVRAG